MSAAELPGAVLFACTMNAVRSPMAAAILHHLAGSKVRVVSAGVRPGERDAFVTAVMGYGNRAQMLGYYRSVRDQLFRKIKQRFGLDGGPSV